MCGESPLAWQDLAVEAVAGPAVPSVMSATGPASATALVAGTTCSFQEWANAWNWLAGPVVATASSLPSVNVVSQHSIYCAGDTCDT